MFSALAYHHPCAASCLPACLPAGELINWLIYVESSEPVCGGQATVFEPPPAMVSSLYSTAAELYGLGLADIIRATPEPFLNDIFDREPLQTLIHERVVLVGDAAHPITPHAGKGSNLALQDALALGQCMSAAWTEGVPEENGQEGAEAKHGAELEEGEEGKAARWRLFEAAARDYDSRRAREVRRVVLASRHYGEWCDGAAIVAVQLLSKRCAARTIVFLYHVQNLHIHAVRARSLSVFERFSV